MTDTDPKLGAVIRRIHEAAANLNWYFHSTHYAGDWHQALFAELMTVLPTSFIVVHLHPPPEGFQPSVNANGGLTAWDAPEAFGDEHMGQHRFTLSRLDLMQVAIGLQSQGKAKHNPRQSTTLNCCVTFFVHPCAPHITCQRMVGKTRGPLKVVVDWFLSVGVESTSQEIGDLPRMLEAAFSEAFVYGTRAEEHDSEVCHLNPGGTDLLYDVRDAGSK